MVSIHVAYTSPINLPTGPKSTPHLTAAQVWAGLTLKIRAGQDFVPALQTCDFVSEHLDPKTGNPVVVRDAVFKPGFAPAGAGGDGRVREICESFPEMRVDFLQPDGSKVMNVVSEGSEGELLLTYTFDWLEPGIGREEKERVEARTREHKVMARKAVEHTIETIRRMVREGTIVA